MSEVPNSVLIDAADQKKAAGETAKRAKGHKHFNQVGYMAPDFKDVPRWAIGDGLEKVLRF